MTIKSPQDKPGTTIISSAGKKNSKTGRSDGQGGVPRGYPVSKSATGKSVTGSEPGPQSVRGYELAKKMKDKPITSANTAPDGTTRVKKF